MLIYHNRMYKNSLHKQELLCSHHLLTSHFIFKPLLAKCYRVFIRFLSKRASFVEKNASHLQQATKIFTSFDSHLPEKPSGCTMFFGKKWLPFLRRFFKLSKGFPLPEKTAPRNLWWWWPRLILLAILRMVTRNQRQAVADLQCLGMKKKLHGLNQLGVVFCFWRKKNQLDANKWGDKTTWCSLIQK